MYKELAVWAVAGILVITCTLLSFAGTEQNNDGQESKQDLFYEVESLNELLVPLDDPPDLSTPRAALVNFFLASRDGRFEQAARSLNFQTIADKKDHLAARYAMKLYYVISQKIDVEYKKVPDRPSGAFEEATDESDSPSESSQPQRSIKIGEVPLSLGHVEIRLERFKPQDGEPVWLFSPRTTEKIQEMYERHGPGPFFDYLPSSMKQGLLTGSAHWPWLLLISVGILAGFSGWVYQKLARVVGGHVAPPLIQKEAMRLATPIGALLGLLTFYVVTYKLISPPGEEVRTLYVISFMFLVAGLTWVGIRFIDLFSAKAARKFDLVIGTYQEEEARVRYTRISVGRHILIFLAVCIGLGLALYQLQVIKNLSLSFLASASVVGVLLGITAPAVLGNMLAGIQIAMTRPVSIGDSIHFEGHWGFVEDITYAYIAIQTWDRRRVIVPISYFISHPFENWSKYDTRILQPIFLYADYHIDVDAVRKKFRELLERSDAWDHTLDPIIQVTGMSEKGIELRALFYAKDPGKGWDLHCELREGLISFLQTMEGGRYLPKHRVELSDLHSKEGISGSGVIHGENPSL